MPPMMPPEVAPQFRDIRRKVEAGERLGFLPGTLTDKIDPYLRPLFDALHDMLEVENIPKLMATGTPGIGKPICAVTGAVPSLRN